MNAVQSEQLALVCKSWRRRLVNGEPNLAVCRRNSHRAAFVESELTQPLSAQSNHGDVGLSVAGWIEQASDRYRTRSGLAQTKFEQTFDETR